MSADAREADPFAGVMALPGVADAVAEAREVVDRLLGHRALRRHAPAVTAESALRGARASAVLAGEDVTLADLREGPPGGGVVQGALRVTGETGALLGAWRRAPMQALARLHTLAAADLVPAPERGRPASPTAAARLQALAAALGARTEAPAIAVGAVVHGEVLSLPAFARGSGLVARGAERLVLVSRGLDRSSLLAPEVGHLELREAYEKAIARYAEGGDGVGAWVRHCAAALAFAAQDALAVCEAAVRR